MTERDLENVSDVKSENANKNKKFVPEQQRRGRKKAAGDGVVFGEHPLKGENCPSASLRGRCTIERVVSLNEA